MPTISELGQRVKAKYPGKYDDLPDEDLGLKVRDKYPGQYDDFNVASEAASPQGAELYQTAFQQQAQGRLEKLQKESAPEPTPAYQPVGAIEGTIPDETPMMPSRFFNPLGGMSAAVSKAIGPIGNEPIPTGSIEGTMPPPDEAPTVPPAVARVAKAAVMTPVAAAEGLVTPENALLAPALALPGVGQVAALGFGAQMLKGIADQAPETIAAAQSGDWDTVTEQAPGLIANALMAAGIGKHTVSKFRRAEVPGIIPGLKEAAGEGLTEGARNVVPREPVDRVGDANQPVYEEPIGPRVPIQMPPAEPFEKSYFNLDKDLKPAGEPPKEPATVQPPVGSEQGRFDVQDALDRELDGEVSAPEFSIEREKPLPLGREILRGERDMGTPAGPDTRPAPQATPLPVPPEKPPLNVGKWTDFPKTKSRFTNANVEKAGEARPVEEAPVEGEGPSIRPDEQDLIDRVLYDREPVVDAETQGPPWSPPQPPSKFKGKAKGKGRPATVEPPAAEVPVEGPPAEKPGISGLGLMDATLPKEVPADISAMGDSVRAEIARRVAEKEKAAGLPPTKFDPRAERMAEDAKIKEELLAKTLGEEGDVPFPTEDVPPGKAYVGGPEDIGAKGLGAAAAGQNSPPTKFSSVLSRGASGLMDFFSDRSKRVEKLREDLGGVDKESGGLRRGPSLKELAPDVRQSFDEAAGHEEWARQVMANTRRGITTILEAPDKIATFGRAITEHGLRQAEARFKLYADEIPSMDIKSLVDNYRKQYSPALDALKQHERFKAAQGTSHTRLLEGAIRTLEDYQENPGSVTDIAARNAETRAKKVLVDAFTKAQSRAVVGEVMSPAEMAAFKADPKNMEAVALFDKEFGQPISAAHRAGGGHFLDVEGPLGKLYAPLIPVEAQKSNFRRVKEVLFRKPDNPRDYFRTGAGEAYETGLKGFERPLSQAFRANKIREGLSKGEAAKIWNVADRFDETPRTIDVNVKGKPTTFKAVSEPIGVRLMSKEGKVLPAPKYIMPEHVAAEMRNLLWTPEKKALESKGKVVYNAVADLFTSLNVGLAADAVGHNKSLTSRFLMGLPWSTHPLVAVKGVIELFRPPQAVENRPYLDRIMSAGGGTPRYAKMTYSKKYAAEFGGELVTESFGKILKEGLGPTIYGPNGMEPRVRVALLRVNDALRAKKGLPETPPNEIKSLMTGFGEYHKELMSPFVRTLKEARLSPFVTAGQTFNRFTAKMVNPLRRNTPDLKGWDRAGEIGNNLATWSIGWGAIWYLTYKGKTGNWPHEDKAPLFCLPDGKGGWTGLGSLMPFLSRSLRATGITGLYEMAKSKDVGRGFRKGTADLAETWLGPLMGPPIRAITGLSWGIQPTPKFNERTGKVEYRKEGGKSVFGLNPTTGKAAEKWEQTKDKGLSTPERAATTAWETGRETLFPGLVRDPYEPKSKFQKRQERAAKKYANR